MAPDSPSRPTAHHRLSPLLNPSSVAVYGASTREHAPGNTAVLFARDGAEARGRTVFPINPKYEEIEGLKAYASMDALPQAPDLAIFCVASERMEQAVTEAARAGAKAGLIFASCYLQEETQPKLTQRIAAICAEAGMELCGGNCMGFYNYHDGFRASAFGLVTPFQSGGITLISHSGSQWGSFLHNDSRWRYNLAISAGQELATVAADYLDYALELDSTRVVGLFLETARQPERFVAALEKARDKGIPVVAMKLARTAAAAHFAATHSGAIAGNHAAYEALFDRYGVISCQTLNEFGATLLMLGGERRVAQGGLAGLLDSGGYREMVTDLASDEGVPLAQLNEATMKRLRARLDPDLEPANPLDAWSTSEGYEEKFTDYFRILSDDPDTAMTLGFYDVRSGSRLHDGYSRAMKTAMAESTKPFGICVNFTAANNYELRQQLADDGLLVLDGTVEGLRAVGHAFEHRDMLARRDGPPPPPPAPEVVASWRARLATGTPLDEAEGLDLIAAFGVPAIDHAVVESEAEAIAVAERLGYPVALKTAVAGIQHKSDVGGVHLNLAGADALRTAWADLAGRLGSRAMVSPMAPRGVEMSLGIIADPQFGPLVMVGSGGILVELLADRRVILPPCSDGDARRHIDRLKARRLLDGMRGQAAADVAALASAVAALSVLAAEVGDLIAGLDINPIIVGATGCIAVDALVIPRTSQT